MSNDEARLLKLPRRWFLTTVGVGTGILAGSLVWRARRHRQVTTRDVLVRNPAFQEIAATTPGHVILYCQQSDGDALAYELNRPAAAIWQGCVAHSEFLNGVRRTIADIQFLSRDSLSRDDEERLMRFISELLSAALVFTADSETTVYFPFVENCS